MVHIYDSILKFQYSLEICYPFPSTISLVRGLKSSWHSSKHMSAHIWQTLSRRGLSPLVLLLLPAHSSLKCWLHPLHCCETRTVHECKCAITKAYRQTKNATLVQSHANLTTTPQLLFWPQIEVTPFCFHPLLCWIICLTLFLSSSHLFNSRQTNFAPLYSLLLHRDTHVTPLRIEACY